MSEGDPQVGLFSNVPYAEYDVWPGLSRGRLWTLYASTPRQFQWEQDHPEETTTEAMEDGQAIHAALLEPERFAETYATGGPINLRTCEPFGRNTKAYREWEAEQGKPCLSRATYDICKGICEAVHAHPFLGPLLKTMEPEVSLQWVHAESGLLLKARLDAVNVKGGIILDLKSTQSAAAHRFGADAYRNGYLFQGGIYSDGFQAAAKREFRKYILAAVEKAPPYDIQCFELTPEQLELGRAQATDALRQYVLCQRFNDWPGYPEELQELILPSWAGQEWTPYADGLETILKDRATIAGREVPPEPKDDDDLDNVIAL